MPPAVTYQRFKNKNAPQLKTSYTYESLTKKIKPESSGMKQNGV